MNSRWSDTQEAEFREGLARATWDQDPRTAIVYLDAAHVAWAAAGESERLRACHAAEAEVFETLVRREAGQPGLAALDLGEAAREWEAAGEPARAFAVLLRFGRPLAALEVWWRAHDLARLAHEAALLATAAEDEGDLLLAAEIRDRSGDVEQAAMLRDRTFAPYLEAGWEVRLDTAERDQRTGSPTWVYARVLDPWNELRSITVDARCEDATLEALRRLLGHIRHVEARVCAIEDALGLAGGWALINDGRLPACDPAGRWRLGASHVASRRTLWETDFDPLRVCDRLERTVRRQPE